MGRNDSKEQEMKKQKNKQQQPNRAGQGNPKLDRPDHPST